MTPQKMSLWQATDEIRAANLGHASRTKRLVKMVDRLAQRPGASLPEAMQTPAEIEGAYQLLNTGAVEPASILGPHVRRTLQRCEEHERVVLIHDTTTFSFGGVSERKGLGRVNDGGQGFFGHMCLAATLERVPLGVLGFRPYRRVKPLSQKSQAPRQKQSDRESLRWGELALGTGRLANDLVTVVHVMDSEADDYELFAALTDATERFVIRAAQNRRVAGTGRGSQKLSDVLNGATAKLEREVFLSERRHSKKTPRSKRNSPRAARKAQLSVSRCAVTIRRPEVSSSSLPETLNLNVVHVQETGAPDGCEPVDWILLTTENVETTDDVANVVDIYRCRWHIEEYFKAIKTGCAYEKSQLESYDALLRYLAMLLPVAWQLLSLRSVGTSQSSTPASNVLSATQLHVLRALSEHPLGKAPTVATALTAIAQLGGHIRANGLPGWQVLWRGMRQVIEGEALILRLERLPKRDQS